jgi:tetratricopeptide (TPR) repeat protein
MAFTMYLKGSKWRMTRRRRRSNPFLIAVLLVLIGASVYVNEVVVPATPPLFIPTPTPTRSPESFVNEARDAFNAGNLSQAIRLYEEAILVDPGNPSIFLELARVQIFSGDYENALTNTKNAQLLNPNNPLAHALQGWALFFLDDNLAAEAEYKEALALDPGNPFAHAFYAELLAYDGLIDRAIEESRAAVDQAPNLLEVRRARGIVFYLTQNYVEAVQEFKAALAVNDNIPDLYILLGLNYRALGDAALAIDAFGVADALNPANAQPDYLISRTYFNQGEFAKAAQYARQAVQNDPDDPFMHAALGMSLYKNQEYNLAIQEMGVAVQEIPLTSEQFNVDLYTFYAYAFLRSNRCAQAVPILQVILDSVPENEIAVINATDGIELCEDVPEPTDTPAGDEPPAEPTATP